jgi:hypothetical protein
MYKVDVASALLCALHEDFERITDALVALGVAAHDVALYSNQVDNDFNRLLKQTARQHSCHCCMC